MRNCFTVVSISRLFNFKVMHPYIDFSVTSSTYQLVTEVSKKKKVLKHSFNLIHFKKIKITLLYGENQLCACSSWTSHCSDIHIIALISSVSHRNDF